MATVAEALAAFLAAAGIRRIYGGPGGGSTLDVIEACRQRRVEFVLSLHETSAALMAATEGDLLNRPGVCLAAAGPGAASSANGVSAAFLDRAPLLLLTDRLPRASAHLVARQSLDQRRLFEGITKATATVTAPRADRLFRWAWSRALAVPRGPIHLDLPANEAGRSARSRIEPPIRERLPKPSRSGIRAAARLLARRGRVVVIAGLGCREPGPAQALLDLVEHLGAPVLTTPRAKGVIPEDHPLAAGVFVGGRLEEELLAKADAALVAGLDPVELLPRSWSAGLPVVSLEEYRAGPRAYEVATEILADLPAALNALRVALPPGGGWGLAEWAGRGAGFKARTRALLAEAGSVRGHGGLAPHRVVELAREIFPRETLVAADSGAHAIAATAFWESYAPKTYLCSSGLATRGYALPAAIAARLVVPDRPVLAFTGDGGFLHSLGDVVTATRLGLALVAIVFVDGSLSLVRVQQEQRRYAPTGVSLGGLDIPKLAESLGALGTEVEDEDGLRAALKDALATTQPAIIAVRVRPQGYRRMLELVRGKTGS